VPEVRTDQVTELLQQWVAGNEKALGILVPLVYQELRRLAHHHLKSERVDHTLQSTALVNEAFLRLNGSDPVLLQNRGARKRDGGCRIAIEDLGELPGAEENVPIVALDHALDALSQVDERQAKIVEMKFFGGLSAQEIAAVLDISLATVERKWATARIWLRREMKRSAS
jgi:DNA-directed RNA polymerase specialized sigma subunit